MEINLASLIPFDAIHTDIDHVISVVDKIGKVILVKDNKPAYLFQKCCEEQLYNTNVRLVETTSNTLQEAMRLVLSKAENKTMHASELADEIYKRRLYLKKDGTKAEKNQIRARCGHYPDMFETLPGNFIKLKDTSE